MGVNTKYGFCKGCQTWVPRDEMLSINATVYDAANDEEKIPLRLCPACHKQKHSQLSVMRWDNVLVTKLEIQTDADLARLSDLDFDDSESMMRAAGLLT